MTGIEAAAGVAAIGVAKNVTKGSFTAAREQKREEQKALLEAAKDTAEFKAAGPDQGQ